MLRINQYKFEHTFGGCIGIGESSSIGGFNQFFQVWQ
jgi:hypothetical protein